MPIVEIWDTPPVGLDGLVEAIPTLDELTWAIMEFWGIARDQDTDLAALERQAVSSETGLTLSAAEFRSFAEQLLQLIDGIVVGYRGDPPTRLTPDLRTSSEIVIEAIDSTLWRVYARDTAVIDALQSRYDDVRPVEPEIALPPMHEES